MNGTETIIDERRDGSSHADAAVPESGSEGLLFSRPPEGYEDGEGGGDGGFEEAEEEAVYHYPSVGDAAGGGHEDDAPEEDGGGNDAGGGETLAKVDEGVADRISISIHRLTMNHLRSTKIANIEDH
jgi:hypothetical protein